MKFLAILSLIAITVSAQGFSPRCTQKRRIDTAKNITAAFNEHDPLKSAEAIQAMPLTRTCPAIVAVDGAPGIEFGFDASSTKNFAIVVRQFFTNVVSKYTDYHNGTVLMDAQVTLGLAYSFDSPVYAHILVPIEFEKTTCLISKLPAFVNVPTDIAGNPIDPPLLPAIPGLEQIGLGDLLKAFFTVIAGLRNPTS